MKRGIHPAKRHIAVIMTDGSFFDADIVSTYSKKVMKLDLDTKKHPAWNPTKDTRVIDSGNRLQKFKHKYAS